MTSPQRRTRMLAVRAAALSALAAACVVGAAATTGPDHQAAEAGVLSAAATSTTTAVPTPSPTPSPGGSVTLPPPPVLTTMRVATFNMLGASHTAPGGNKPGWASGTQRMQWAVQIIRNNKLRIVGMQEFQVPQYTEFENLLGSRYAVYPGRSLGDVAVQNSIAWDQTTWRALEEHTIKIPYFNGVMTDEPYVLLQNVDTGQTVWVYNSHNPAGVKGAGDTVSYRARAVATEVGLFHTLETQYPGVPILDTGDKNDVAPYFCPIAAQTDLHAAAGGSYMAATKTCTVPKPATIDWIFGSPNVTFAHYTILHSALVQKTTDHSVYYADATLPPTNTIRYVVGIDIEGLLAGKLNDRSIALPHLRSLMAGGAITTNARTAFERVGTLPNVIGMLTSRPATVANGGTGVVDTTGTPPSVTQAHGSYVASIFDTVHDAGMGTGLWTSNAQLAQMVSKTWAGGHGAADTVPPDNGTTKLSVIDTTSYDRVAMNALVADLTHAPKAFSFIDMTAANRIALAEGPSSPKYAAALQAIDGYVGTLMRAISDSQTLRGHTAVLLTSDHGGVRTSGLRVTNSRATRVPFLAWGPGIAPGSHIYALNPQLKDPGTNSPGYRGAQPVRNLDLGNVAASLLGLPGILDSRIDSDRGITLITQQ